MEQQDIVQQVAIFCVYSKLYKKKYTQHSSQESHGEYEPWLWIIHTNVV